MVRVMLLLLLLLLLSVLYCADQWDVQSIVKRIVAELQLRTISCGSIVRRSLPLPALQTTLSCSHTRLAGRCSGENEGLSDGASAERCDSLPLACLLELTRVL